MPKDVRIFRKVVGAMPYVTYNGRIYPNSEQKKYIEDTFDACCEIFNYLLEFGEKFYEETGKNLSRFDMFKEIAVYIQEHPDFKRFDCTALRAESDFLNEAKKAFFKKNNSFPHRKEPGSVCSFATTSGSIHFKDGFLKIPKMSPIRVHLGKSPEGEAKVKKASIIRNRAGQYFASFVCETDGNALPVTNKAIGIDMGVDRFLTDSDGNIIDAPQYYKKAHDKLKYEQQKLSRMQKGSHNYIKQQQKVAKCHLKIQRQRDNFQYIVAKQYINNNQIICVEDLNTAGMVMHKKKKTKKKDEEQTVSNTSAEPIPYIPDAEPGKNNSTVCGQKRKNINRSINDVAMSSFLIKLQYKADMAGRTLVRIDRYFPSSQICHCCGYQNPAVKDLKIREWDCPECGVHHDRDYNAAINILSEGMKQLA